MYCYRKKNHIVNDVRHLKRALINMKYMELFSYRHILYYRATFGLYVVICSHYMYMK